MLLADPELYIPDIGSNQPRFKEVFANYEMEECCSLLNCVQLYGDLGKYGFAAAMDILTWHRKKAEQELRPELLQIRERWFSDCCEQLCVLLGYDNPQEREVACEPGTYWSHEGGLVFLRADEEKTFQ